MTLHAWEACMHRSAFLLLLVGIGCSATAGHGTSGARSQAPEGFWDHWGDGRAEIAGYTLTMPRYGELRTGEAVLVTVTEGFDPQAQVKSDRVGDDVVPVLKLNHVVDFQTGIYDYNTMTSTFLRLDGGLPRGVPTRISFSMQEWCGQTSERVTATGRGLVHTLDSYFEGESVDDQQLRLPSDAVAEDALPGLLRGLTGTPPEGSIHVLPRLLDGRLQHTELAWQEGVLRRSEIRTLSTPSGDVQVVPWVLDGPAGSKTWYIGVDPPHLLVGWDGTDGEQARLTGHMRTAYWKEAGEGKERLRADLGLPPRAP